MVVNDRRVRANRANAARSTGPRTEAGKAAARLNALRHGLAAASHSEPGADEEIEALALTIVGAESGSDLLALARRIADAELDLRRVRRAQVALETRHLESLRANSSRGISRRLVQRLLKRAPSTAMKGAPGHGANLRSAITTPPGRHYRPVNDRSKTSLRRKLRSLNNMKSMYYLHFGRTNPIWPQHRTTAA